MSLSTRLGREVLKAEELQSGARAALRNGMGQDGVITAGLGITTALRSGDVALAQSIEKEFQVGRQAQITEHKRVLTNMAIMTTMQPHPVTSIAEAIRLGISPDAIKSTISGRFEDVYAYLRDKTGDFQHYYRSDDIPERDMYSIGFATYVAALTVGIPDAERLIAPLVNLKVQIGISSRPQIPPPEDKAPMRREIKLEAQNVTFDGKSYPRTIGGIRSYFVEQHVDDE